MKSNPKTVREYVGSLSEDRRESIEAICKVIRRNLSKGYEEGMQGGMPAYYVPHSVYPPGYHCDPKKPLPFASVASQKNHIGVHLFCLYIDPKLMAWFQKEWKKTGVKLDMGKSCIRFKNAADVPIHLIGEVIKKVPAKRFIAHYEAILKSTGKSTAKKKTAAKKAVKNISKTRSRKTTLTAKRKA